MTEFSIDLFLEVNNEYIEGNLRSSKDQDEAFFAFYPIDKSNTQKIKKYSLTPKVKFGMNDIHQMRQDNDDVLTHSILVRNSNIYKFSFDNDKDIRVFFNYVTSKANVLYHPANKTYVFGCHGDNSPINIFQDTNLPNLKDESISPSLESNYKGLIKKNSFTAEVLNEKDYDDLFDESGRPKDINSLREKIYNVDVDKKVARKMWFLLINEDLIKCTESERESYFLSKRETYVSVKKLWKLTTKRQWEYCSELRRNVTEIEKFILNNSKNFEHFKRPSLIQKLAFNIVLTATFYDADNADTIIKCTGFVYPLILSFVCDACEESVSLHDGQTLSWDECESDIFWCFYTILENNIISVGPEYYTKILQSTGGLLEKYFKEILHYLLNRKSMKTINFIKDDLCSWFTNCFYGNDIVKLFVSIFSFPSSFQFYQCFIVSLLYYFLGNIIFPDNYNTLKFDMNIDTLLRNSIKIFRISQKTTA